MSRPAFLEVTRFACHSTNDVTGSDDVVGVMGPRTFSIGAFTAGDERALSISLIVPQGVSTLRIVELDLSGNDLIGTIDLTADMDTEVTRNVQGDDANYDITFRVISASSDVAERATSQAITVHERLGDDYDTSALDATNITIPVTVANDSSHTISDGGRVTIKNFHPFGTSQNVPIFFSEIAAGDEETQYANWELELDDSGNPTYPTAWSYTLHAADGGAWRSSDVPGDFVSLKVHVYDSDLDPS
jgi:hypothetical protein